MAIATFIFGILLGAGCAYVMFRPVEVGTLRVDTSDPDDGPYMFLEINKGVGDITSKHYILLKVDLNSYLSRK